MKEEGKQRQDAADSEEGADLGQEAKEQPEQRSKAEDDKEAEADESQEPAREDCFEYRLVGVTVHSGTAHAGHYWSYIDTGRGDAEEWPGEGDGGEDGWGDTDGGRWTEFNDSTVRDFQASKLKEECFGGDSGGSGGFGSFGLSSLDGWGLSGSYGKSGYMLFYERRQKKPLRLRREEAAEAKEAVEPKASGAAGQEREECTEVDYRDAVAPGARPNKLFLGVLEENRKHGFENDIYSQDFYDFVLTLQKDILGLQGEDETVKELRSGAVALGSKTALELLARAFSNSCIDEHVGVLLEALRADKSADLARELMDAWYREDGFDYLFALLLECPDTRARTGVATLLKHVLVALKMREKDFLLEPEDYVVEGDDGARLTMQRHRALSSRFVVQALDLLNSRVAKNWSRFDQFHDLLHFFALADLEDLAGLTPVQEQGKDTGASRPSKGLDRSSPGARLGLEFFVKVGYVEKASDFMLGKKSPLCGPAERRPELGGTYAHPDLSGVIKLMTAMITDEELSTKYPMSDTEKQMVLHPDLLKTMLGSATASKQFGACLANMCRDDTRLSRKVSKVFLRAIEQAHLDTVKGYLKALKPFLRADDSLKQLKLEWIFGVPEVVSRKVYGASRSKWGLELVDRVNEEAIKFVSPILAGGACDEALIAQIVKCRGRFDVQCISCLKELLSLMRKDREIARFIYQLPPSSYQGARFTDWVRPYLEEQLADSSRASAATNQYFKNKYSLLTKALAHLDGLQPTLAEFESEQLALLDTCLAEGGVGFTDLAGHWAGTKSEEVIKHFPPQLIVGKQVADDRELHVDDSHPLVRVTIYELDCEHGYSAPTGMFNLQLPHVEVRASHYQSQSYAQYKAAEAAADKSQDEAGTAREETAGDEQQDWGTRAWDDWKREGPILLKVVLSNKTKDQDLKVWYRLGLREGTPASSVNVRLARSSRKTQLYAKNEKTVETLLKVDPTKAFFIQDLAASVVVELDATVRTQNAAAGYGAGHGKTVRMDAAVGGDGTDPQDTGDLYDEDDRDDDAAYARYQENPGHDGYPGAGADQEHLAGLLNLQPQQLESSDGARRSDGSTQAVGDGGMNGSGPNSAGDLEPYGYDGDMAQCAACRAFSSAGSFQCSACGQYLGGQD
jgi:hypothetical protein